MKPLTIALALKANVELKKQGKKPIFSPLEKVATANGSFPGRSKPIHDTHCHAYLNMYLALQKSSNIYMARMVQRIIDALGENWYRDCFARNFWIWGENRNRTAFRKSLYAPDSRKTASQWKDGMVDADPLFDRIWPQYSSQQHADAAQLCHHRQWRV